MGNRSIFSIVALAVSSAILLTACASSPNRNSPNNAWNNRQNVAGREWHRGCADFKAGYYDRKSTSQAYENGWNNCKAQARQANNTNIKQREWNRGCSDIRRGHYDRRPHSPDYDAGWQACK